MASSQGYGEASPDKSAITNYRPKLDLSKYKICAAPKFKQDQVALMKQKESDKQLNLRKLTDLPYNPEYSELKEAEEREQEELRSQGKLMKKNTLTGHVELTHLDAFQFEDQRRQHHFKNKQIIGDKVDTDANNPANINNRSAKRVRNDDPSDLEGYMGPWATFEGEEGLHVSKPNPEDAAIMAEQMAKRKKRSKPTTDQPTAEIEHRENAKMHIKDPYDYQGRSFLVAPRDLDGVNLQEDALPQYCRIPRNLAHTYRGHTKPITATRYFPRTAHLLLSSSLDNKVKLWELYKEKRCIMTFSGHKNGVRDICFNNTGDKFVSASYDKYMKLWDSETGQCIQRFTNNRMAYCVKFNPSEENAHLFLTGMADKKVLCWDCRTGETVQEYDRHLGAVNSITFVDENRKFITSSDDKSLRVWEWDIPVDIKYIADPMMHSMPAVVSSPNNRRLLCQSMDNKLQAFTCHNKFKLDNNKIFRGHMVAGYACVPDFSPDMSLVMSGDADGKIFFWSWASTKIITTVKAHDGVCINVMWHPHEKQKLVSAGWDNLIKVWD